MGSLLVLHTFIKLIVYFSTNTSRGSQRNNVKKNKVTGAHCKRRGKVNRGEILKQLQIRMKVNFDKVTFS